DKDLTVTVSFSNLIYTTIGEVQHPGAYAIDRDRITLLEALGRSGDLTIYGRRDHVWVIREEGGERKTYKVDLRSTDFMQSPAYYVQQNDVIYVEPNETRTGQSTVNENTFKSVGFWTSITSVLISIATLVVTLTR
ncbi:MAG: polysaccharide export protein, partial [Muribaculaceae bacterium]|nr:polysaccharide export protein [Muribaculaceae bacterium]